MVILIGATEEGNVRHYFMECLCGVRLVWCQRVVELVVVSVSGNNKEGLDSRRHVRW